MGRLLALLLVWAVQGCEPCAITMGGHCQDREQNRDEDMDNERCFAQPNAPLPLIPRRGARG